MCISAPAGIASAEIAPAGIGSVGIASVGIASAGIASAGIASAGIASGVVVTGSPCLKDCPATLPNLIGHNKGWFYAKLPIQTSMSMKKANFMDKQR